MAPLLVLVAALPCAAARRSSVTCDAHRDGPKGITSVTVTLGRGRRALTLVEEMTDIAGGDATLSLSATMGKKSVVQSVVTLSGGSVHTTTDLGLGFRGIRHVEMTSPDGVRFTGVVDGRPVVASAQGGGQTAPSFTDGNKAPKLRVKPDVRRGIKKALALVKKGQCDNQPTASLARIDDCDLCQLGCQFNPAQAASALCAVNIFATAVLCNPETAVLCVVTFEINGVSCAAGAANCSQKCLTSDACCKVHCPGAVGLCCNGDGEVCCAEDGPNQGTCCTSCCGNPKDADAVCCGRRTPQSEEMQCIDPVQKLCCEPDGTLCANGTECCAPGETCCGDYCAPGGQACCSTATSPKKFFFCGVGQVCADPESNLCCPTGSGPGCNDVCCSPNQVCAPGNHECCSPLDVCGDTCCPSHNCINGTLCCDAPNHQCGSNCCAPLEQCCNGQCCPGTCLAGGVCCPSVERTCGTTCCPPNQFCENPATSTCQTCPGGVGEPCAPGGSNPPCCPSSSQCCSNGTCCAEGESCCASPGQPTSCQPSFQCVH